MHSPTTPLDEVTRRALETLADALLELGLEDNTTALLLVERDGEVTGGAIGLEDAANQFVAVWARMGEIMERRAAENS